MQFRVLFHCHARKHAQISARRYGDVSLTRCAPEIIAFNVYELLCSRQRTIHPVMDHQPGNSIVFLSPEIYAKGDIIHYSGEKTVSCRIVETLSNFEQDDPSKLFIIEPHKLVTIRGDTVVEHGICQFDGDHASVNIYHDNSCVYDSLLAHKPYIITMHFPPNSSRRVLIRDCDVPQLQDVIKQFACSIPIFSFARSPDLV